jgi:hypothetical protein
VSNPTKPFRTHNQRKYGSHSTAKPWEFGNIAIGFGTGFAPNNGVSIGIGQINIGDVDVDIIYPPA